MTNHPIYHMYNLKTKRLGSYFKPNEESLNG